MTIETRGDAVTVSSRIMMSTTQGYFTKSVSVVRATSPAKGDTSVEIPWEWVTLGIITVTGVAFAVVLREE